MKKYNSDFSFVSDLEILDKVISYLNALCSFLPSRRLQYHCNGAMVSVFELFYFLLSHNLVDYGNNNK